MTIDRSSSPRRGCSGCSGCRDGAGFPLATRAAFHPIIDLHRERVFAYEALIRGEAGEGAAFVLDQSGGGADVRLRPGLPGHRDPRRGRGRDRGNRAKLSINFLPNAVYSPMACIQLTLRTARETGFPADRLIFEFTENEKLQTEHVQAIVEAYRQLGFLTAVDDFGAGYAGLGLLAALQTDMVKLDMELIRGIDADGRRRAVLEAVVQLMRRLGTEIVAEGVETAEELAVLRLFGVRYVQGFLFGQPLLGELTPYPDWLREPQRQAAIN